MTPETVVEVGRQALIVLLMVAGPMLLSALAIGLLVSIFQAATQINEATLKKYGLPGKGTEFTCGETKFLMTSFSNEFSDIALGGYFPVTKTLSQIGCKLEGKLLLCREEGPFKAKGADLKAYREIVAEVISTPGK